MLRTGLVLCVLMALQGCAAVLVAGGVGVAASAHDRRSLGTQIDDKTATSRIYQAIAAEKDLDDASHIVVSVFNGVVLLTGQTPTDEFKRRAGELAAGVENLRKVHNQIRINQPTAPSTRAYDIWLASKLKTKLLADERVDGLHIEVVVEDSEVFLLGLVNEDEAAIAVDIARNADGVAQVIKAFEYRS